MGEGALCTYGKEKWPLAVDEFTPAMDGSHQVDMRGHNRMCSHAHNIGAIPMACQIAMGCTGGEEMCCGGSVHSDVAGDWVAQVMRCGGGVRTLAAIAHLSVTSRS